MTNGSFPSPQNGTKGESDQEPGLPENGCHEEKLCVLPIPVRSVADATDAVAVKKVSRETPAKKGGISVEVTVPGLGGQVLG